MPNTVSFCSYNCRGWRGGSEYVSYLLQSCDLCCIQEHWLLPDNLDALNLSNDFLSIGISGMESAELLAGRPFGRCAILYRKTLSPFISRVPSLSKRFCAIFLRLLDPSINSIINTLLINVYLPTNYNTDNSDNLFLETIAELDSFISAQSFDNLILCGDFNIDFSRRNNNCILLSDLMSAHNLVRADLNSNISFTYRRDDFSACSWPDHILISSQFSHLIKEVSCEDSVDNFSDHLPVFCTSNLTCPANTSNNPPFQRSSSSDTRIAWDKITSDHINSYCDCVRENLPSLSNELLSCCDPSCSSHQSLLNETCTQLLQCITNAATASFPKVSTRAYSHRVPGWNDAARSFRTTASFWNRLWTQCGRPSSGVLSQIKRRTKSRYKYEVRRLKRQREHIIREKIGLAFSQSRHKDFWREVQKVNRSSRGNSQSTSCVDGCVRDSDISCLFEGKLKSLLNSQDDLESRSNLLTVIETSLSSDDLVSSNISPEVVSMALKRIKPGKSDGTDLFSDHFRYASSSLSDFLAKFFTVMLRHGHIPESLRDCVLQPVLKPGKDPCCSDSYRPIALAPTLSKVFEWCLLLLDRDAFSTSPLQFGFKEGFSSDLCTGLLKNVIARYTINDSVVYGCFLDASKAFDRVNHSVLFEKLLRRKLSCCSAHPSNVV